MYKEDTWTCYLKFVLIRLGFIKKASIDSKSFGVFSNQITELWNFNSFRIIQKRNSSLGTVIITDPNVTNI